MENIVLHNRFKAGLTQDLHIKHAKSFTRRLTDVPYYPDVSEECHRAEVGKYVFHDIFVLKHHQ